MMPGSFFLKHVPHAGAILAVLLLGALTGQATLAGRQVRAHDSTWKAPSQARARANPLAGRTDVEAGGARVFGVRCTGCHGPDARGGPHAPDLTRAAVQAQSDGALFWKITGGNTRAGMPAFSFLPELQRWQLVQHVRRAAASTRRPSSRSNVGEALPEIRH